MPKIRKVLLFGGWILILSLDRLKSMKDRLDVPEIGRLKVHLKDKTKKTG